MFRVYARVDRICSAIIFSYSANILSVASVSDLTSYRLHTTTRLATLTETVSFWTLCFKRPPPLAIVNHLLIRGILSPGISSSRLSPDRRPLLPRKIFPRAGLTRDAFDPRPVEYITEWPED